MSGRISSKFCNEISPTVFNNVKSKWRGKRLEKKKNALMYIARKWYLKKLGKNNNKRKKERSKSNEERKNDENIFRNAWKIGTLFRDSRQNAVYVKRAPDRDLLHHRYLWKNSGIYDDRQAPRQKHILPTN